MQDKNPFTSNGYIFPHHLDEDFHLADRIIQKFFKTQKKKEKLKKPVDYDIQMEGKSITDCFSETLSLPNPMFSQIPLDYL